MSSNDTILETPPSSVDESELANALDVAPPSRRSVAVTRVLVGLLLVALGAQRGSILGQFLAEATILSLAGGALGVLVGVVASRFTISGVQPVLVPASILLAFGVSAAIGLFFGSMPANRAARLLPVEALRYQ